MKIIAIIGARGGSKRIPNKNIRLLSGKPLIAWTIETALKSKLFDRVIVSTEDKKIAEISKKFGAETPFMRPKALAQDKVSRWKVLQHVVKELEKKEGYLPDIIVDLSPTSPLRNVQDIKRCLKKLINEKAGMVTSVFESERNPYFNMLEVKKGGKVNLVKKAKKRIFRSQDAPKVYSMNDSVNVATRRALLKNEAVPSLDGKTKIVIMPKERSIDIDEEFDFLLTEFIVKNSKQ